MNNIVANIDKYFKSYSFVIDDFRIFFIYVFNKCKNIDNVLRIINVVIKLRMSQSDLFIIIKEETLINIIEFVVAIYKESICYIRILTTFVRIIDAKIEVKVEINFENYKSIIRKYFAFIACLNDLIIFLVMLS